MDTTLSLEGRQLGNYEVVRRIRAGGMGAVYEGKQRTAFDRRVAIKVILGDYASDPDMRRRFAREAKTIARLHHPHILQLIEFGDEQGFLYLVMPYIDGGTLTSYLRQRLPELEDVSVIYQQLLDAVEYAHEAGLIHRDIKSSNVLMEKRRGGTPYVYLADFGLVRTSKNTAQVGKDIPLDKVPGTPHYMAPEQTRGIITTSTDIYALGVLLYQMLTGELPYKDEDDVRVIQMHMYAPIPSPSDYDASIPEALDDVVRVAMAKQPEDRFKTVAELRTAFLAALKSSTVFADDEPVIEYDDLYSPSLHRSVPLAQVDIPAPLPPGVPVHELENPVPLDLPPAPRRRVRQTRDVQPVMEVRERPVRLARSAQLNRPRTTETLNPPPQRVTDEPVRRKARIARVPLIMAMVVPAALLILLLMPRVLGFSFFPSGFPVFGTPPVATVYVTTQSKPFDGRYILTASSQTTTPDITTHTLPDHVLQATAQAVQTVPATGTKTIPGTQARGYVLFSNSTNKLVTIPALVITSTTGVSVQLTQAVQIPPRQAGQNGRASVLALSVNIGASGNIAAHTLDGMCCNNGVASSNTDSFYGGTDPQNVAVVAQSDVDAVQNALVPKLQQQVMQKLKQQLHGDETIAGQPAFTINTTSDTPVGSPTKQIQVTVNVQGMASSYSRNVVNQMVTQLLDKEALSSSTLGNGYQQQGTPTIAIASTDVHKGSVVYLTVSAHSTWMYVFSSSQLDAWRQTIKGATPTAALAYLNAQQGVAGVQ
ncbi:MAG TPA: hypothetical protein DHW02_07855, partial [Ktedonobacter sp.]|nr:hypothetical protein [Ktedonobacter sp.]